MACGRSIGTSSEIAAFECQHDPCLPSALTSSRPRPDDRFMDHAASRSRQCSPSIWIQAWLVATHSNSATIYSATSCGGVAIGFASGRFVCYITPKLHGHVVSKPHGTRTQTPPLGGSDNNSPLRKRSRILAAAASPKSMRNRTVTHRREPKNEPRSKTNVVRSPDHNVPAFAHHAIVRRNRATSPSRQSHPAESANPLAESQSPHQTLLGPRNNVAVVIHLREKTRYRRRRSFH